MEMVTKIDADNTLSATLANKKIQCEVDPLIYPKCGMQIRIIAFIED